MAPRRQTEGLGQKHLERMRYLCEPTVKGTISIEEVDLTAVSQEDQHRINQNYAMTKLNLMILAGWAAWPRNHQWRSSPPLEVRLSPMSPLCWRM